MARSRKKSEVLTDKHHDIAEGHDVFDEAIAARKAAQETQETIQREFVAGHHADQPTAERKKWTPPKDPFGFENMKAGENRVQLLKSEGEGAWVIRFAHNPNLDKGPDGETYSKENPHPVLKMLKGESYRWGFDGGDQKGGWGKRFTGDANGADHIEARRVLQKAADMIGHKLDQGRIPD
jgi:hypothetical protein